MLKKHGLFKNVKQIKVITQKSSHDKSRTHIEEKKEKHGMLGIKNNNTDKLYTFSYPYFDEIDMEVEEDIEECQQ